MRLLENSHEIFGDPAFLDFTQTHENKARRDHGERQGDPLQNRFQDGAKGKGLDIVSGNVDRDRIIVGLDRKQLKGAMVARLADAEFGPVKGAA